MNVSPQVIAILITIVGAGLGLLLTVNAYFFKEMVTSLKSIQLQLVKLTTLHDRVSKDVEELKIDNRKLNERLHTIEGREELFIQMANNINTGE